MFPFISRLVLNSRFPGHAAAPRSFLPWDHIQRMAVIIGAESQPAKHAVDQFILETKKFVEVFFIETRSKVPSYNDWICFIKKDKSFLDLPKADIENSLKQKKFDLVINTCDAANVFSAAVSASLSAPLKSAPSQRFHDAHLIIRKNPNKNVLDYLNDTLHYLRMIRS